MSSENINSPKCRIDHTRGVATEAFLHGHEGGHFPQRGHDEEDRDSDHDVGYEQTSGPAPDQRCPRADDEAGPDGTGEREHGHLTPLEVSVQVIVEHGIFRTSYLHGGDRPGKRCLVGTFVHFPSNSHGLACSLGRRLLVERCSSEVDGHPLFQLSPR